MYKEIYNLEGGQKRVTQILTTPISSTLNTSSYSRTLRLCHLAWSIKSFNACQIYLASMHSHNKCLNISILIVVYHFVLKNYVHCEAFILFWKRQKWWLFDEVYRLSGKQHQPRYYKPKFNINPHFRLFGLYFVFGIGCKRISKVSFCCIFVISILEWHLWLSPNIPRQCSFLR